MERSRRRNPVDRPKCWTEYLNEHEFEGIPRGVLCQRDVNSGYTVVHALASSNMPANELQRKFEYLERMNVMGKCTAKDREGDMPLQSAVYSEADCDTITLILHSKPGAAYIMLNNQNAGESTALESCLEQGSIQVFRLLLRECLRVGALQHLTCTGDKNRPCATLLHKCIKRRLVQHLNVFLDMCTVENKNIIDEKGNTPWYYLVRYNECKDFQTFDKILKVLADHDINLDNLIAKKKSKETMLHQAYRLKKWKFIRRLERVCAETVDRFKRKPQERDRRLNVVQTGQAEMNEIQPDPQAALREEGGVQLYPVDEDYQPQLPQEDRQPQLPLEDHQPQLSHEDRQPREDEQPQHSPEEQPLEVQRPQQHPKDRQPPITVLQMPPANERLHLLPVRNLQIPHEYELPVMEPNPPETEPPLLPLLPQAVELQVPPGEHELPLVHSVPVLKVLPPNISDILPQENQAGAPHIFLEVPEFQQNPHSDHPEWVPGMNLESLKSHERITSHIPPSDPPPPLMKTKYFTILSGP